ncbi:MAG: hypothetical protein RMJ28_06985 [Nitrososphaerota archaeon]|nr:hypothetical protein [Candidatus Calditenuaceae archaeon]MDW8073958.1 hypothetical protein [Nitrososphaerota archaeon]
MSEYAERTRLGRLFAREATVEVEGVEFRLRRMTLREELEWMALRDKVMSDETRSREERIVEVWGDLLRRVIVKPKLESPVEELPAAVVSLLTSEIERLHLWDLPLQRPPRVSR